MLEEMLRDLMKAETPKEKERAYRRLEKVGMDRRTAMAVAADLRKEKPKNEEWN